MKPRYGPSSALLMNIFFALKGSKLSILLVRNYIFTIHNTVKTLYNVARYITDYSICDVKNCVH